MTVRINTTFGKLPLKTVFYDPSTGFIYTKVDELNGLVKARLFNRLYCFSEDHKVELENISTDFITIED